MTLPQDVIGVDIAKGWIDTFTLSTQKNRRIATRTCDALWQAVGRVCDLFNEEECYNSFKAAGWETD